MRAAKWSELKRCSKKYIKNHTKQCKLFTKKEKVNTRVIYYVIKWMKTLSFRFDLCLIVFLICLHFYILSHFEIIRCIVKSLNATSTYFLFKYNWKKKTWKLLLHARVWAPNIHQFKPGPTPNIWQELQKHWVKRFPPMEHLSNDHKDCCNQNENSQSFMKEHSHFSLKESQWKLRQEHDQNFPMEGKAL